VTFNWVTPNPYVILMTLTVVEGRFLIASLRTVSEECWTLRLQDISPTRHFAYDMDTSPIGQFAYETFRLLDTSPTPWTVRPLNVNTRE